MKTLYLVVPLLALYACSVEPEAIDYGKEACAYCKMNIVDQQHASEIVTKKGKIYKYDAIECMLNDKENNDSEKVQYFLVMDYNSPNTFLDATSASYLISENLPSPMGANLTAFSKPSVATEMQQEKGGEVYDWSNLKKLFIKQ